MSSSIILYLQPASECAADRWRDEGFCFPALAHDIESGRYDPAAALFISDELCVRRKSIRTRTDVSIDRRTEEYAVEYKYEH